MCVEQPAQQELLLYCHGLTLGNAVIHQSQRISNKQWVLKKATEETKLPDVVKPLFSGLAAAIELWIL